MGRVDDTVRVDFLGRRRAQSWVNVKNELEKVLTSVGMRMGEPWREEGWRGSPNEPADLMRQGAEKEARPQDQAVSRAGGRP